MTNSGVYQIINKVNGHRYVGSSINLDKRRREHKGWNGNIILKRACAKHGAENLEFQILIYCAPEHRIMYEQMIIDGFQPEYNICPIAGSSLGRITSDETKQKMSITSRGNTNWLGKNHSAATKRKLSNASRGNTHLLGHTHSEESIEKMRMAKLGNVHFEETKQKISDSLLGNTNCRGNKLSKEHKRNIGEGVRNYWKNKKEMENA